MAVATAAAAVALGGVGPALGGCVSPAVGLDVASAPVGGTVVVQGRYFASECNDTGSGGCSRRSDEAEPEEDIRIELHQGDLDWALARVDAGSDYTFAAPVEIPEKVLPGPALVRVLSRHGHPVGPDIPIEVLG